MAKNEAKKTEQKDVAKKNNETKRFRLLATGCAFIIVITIAALFFLSGSPEKIRKAANATTTTTTTKVTTTSPEDAAREALWAEHNALFDLVVEVLWECDVTRIEELMPSYAWRNAEEQLDMSYEEAVADVQKNLETLNYAAVRELSEDYTVRYYIAGLEEVSDDELEKLQIWFNERYEIPVESFSEAYFMDVECVTTDGEKRNAEREGYISITVDGKRYLTTGDSFLL